MGRKKVYQKLLSLLLIFSWLLAAWPPIWLNPRIPPKIKGSGAVSPEIFNSSGTYTAATGIYAVDVACWGGGGGGGGSSNAGKVGSGGGGGGYSKKTNISVTPGSGYSVIVGTGGSGGLTGSAGNDSYFIDTATVLAKGGSLGAGNDSGGNAVGGQASAGVGDADKKFNGGNGGDGSGTDTAGGGGGEGAGSTVNGGNGGDAVGTTPGSAGTGTDGGDGGLGGSPGGAGNFGTAPGGGGSGSGNKAGTNLSGGNGADGQCIVSYTDIWAPSTDPTTYSTTWSFTGTPFNQSAVAIGMTAFTGYDYTGPIQYLFTNDNSNCGVNAGTGGTTSTWQTDTSYSDSGLDVNKCYGYKVVAKDSVGVGTSGVTSSISSTYTSANIPGTPTLGSETGSSLTLTNDENGNPSTNPTTTFAVQVVTTNPSDATWLNQWVDGSGNPSGSEVWLNDSELDGLPIVGLNAGTTYGVKVKAKNQDGDATSLSAEGQGTTTATVYSVSIVNTGKTVSYGTLNFGQSKSTLDLSETKMALNDGTGDEKLNIMTTAATGGTGWGVGSSAGTNIFVHEYSVNGGGAWTKLAAAESYQTLVASIGVGITQNIDLRITVPDPSTDAVEKSISVTIQAVVPD